MMLRSAILSVSLVLALAGLATLGGSMQQTIVQVNDAPENVLSTEASTQYSMIEQAAQALLAGQADGAVLAASAHYADAAISSREDREALVLALRRSVQEHPTNFYLWARLAKHELALRHYAESGEAYKMALHTGKHLPSARKWIIENGHDNWFYLNEKEQGMVNAKVSALFAESPNAVAGLAYTDWRAGFVIEALRDDAAALAVFRERWALMHDPAFRRAAQLPEG